jgi:hypothetical protein
MNGAGAKFKTGLAFQHLGRQAPVKARTVARVERPYQHAERSRSRENPLFVQSYSPTRHGGRSSGRSGTRISKPRICDKNHDAVFNFAGLQSATMVADNNTLTPEQMAVRIAELEGRLAKNSTLSFKVSEKGAVSVYGLGRFPVTLYFEQWNKLLAQADELRTFLEANKSKLKLKEQPPR